MKIDIKSNIQTTQLETVDIHIEFNPLNDHEERVAALITTFLDTIKKYDQLNTLAD